MEEVDIATALSTAALAVKDENELVSLARVERSFVANSVFSVR